MTLHVRWFRNVLLNDKKCQNLTRKSFPTNVKCDVDQKKKNLIHVINEIEHNENITDTSI